MSEVVPNAEHEFWRPPVPGVAAQEGVTPARRMEVCSGCGAEFVPGAMFCHACGTTRTVEAALAQGWTRYLEFHNIQEWLALPTPSLLAFIVGLGCVLASVAVGLFSVQTVLDWQAVQVWRIQWLLGAAVSFLAGCLLKRNAS